MSLEGYIRRIEENGDGITVLTVEIVKPKRPFAPDIAQFDNENKFSEAEAQHEKLKEDYNKRILEEEKLHIGLITLSQSNAYSGSKIVKQGIPMKVVEYAGYYEEGGPVYLYQCPKCKRVATHNCDVPYCDCKGAA